MYYNKFLHPEKIFSYLRATANTTDDGHAQRAKNLFTRLGSNANQILSTSSKVDKSQGYGTVTDILYLNPHTYSNVCTHKSACIKTCLLHAGHNNRHLDRRDNTTRILFQFPLSTIAWILSEIESNAIKAHRDGYKYAIRLNGTSDLPWHEWIDMQKFTEYLKTMHADIIWYDYTKVHTRISTPATPEYSLTFSVDEKKKALDYALTAIRNGHNTSMVVTEPTKQRLLSTYPYLCVDGDLHDMTYLYSGKILLLKYKIAIGQDNTDPKIIVSHDRVKKLIQNL